MNEWIPWPLRSGQAIVKCLTCDTEAEFDSTNQMWHCDCRFGASNEALAYGLRSYEWQSTIGDMGPEKPETLTMREKVHSLISELFVRIKQAYGLEER